MNRINIKSIILILLIIILLIIKYALIKYNVKYYITIINPLLWFCLFLTSYKLSNKLYHRRENKQNIMQRIFIILIIYLLINFTSGLIFGYGENIYKRDFYSILINIWSFVYIIFFQEYTRYQILINSRKSRLIFIFTIILYSILEINLNRNIESYSDMFIYITSVIIPIILTNVFLTYISRKYDYYVTCLYRAILVLANILLPIIPRYPDFILFIFNISLPIITYLFVREKNINFNKLERKPNISVPIYLMIILFAFFIAGYFKYKPIGVLSNSMNPVFSRGDIVVIKSNNNSNYKVGDIIQYKKQNNYIIHRIIFIDKTNTGKKVYITKGDNNNYFDNGGVYESQIIGNVKLIIPKLGYPSVLFHEILNR